MFWQKRAFLPFIIGAMIIFFVPFVFVVQSVKGTITLHQLNITPFPQNNIYKVLVIGDSFGHGLWFGSTTRAGQMTPTSRLRQ